MKILICMFCIGCAINLKAGSLLVSQESISQSGARSIVGLKLRNEFDVKVESARALVLLLDKNGKTVAQAARWIIDDSSAKNGLLPQKEKKFNLILRNEKEFVTAKVMVTRIVLADGKVVTPPLSASSGSK